MTKTLELYSFTFVTDLSLAEILQCLRAQGVWEWIERDSDRWGDYISTSGLQDAIVKVFDGEPNPGKFTANVKFESDASDAAYRRKAIRETLLTETLPAIGARAVTEGEYLE